MLIPCLNEADTVGSVVAGFRRSLPDALIYVYDNGSTDETARIAADAGATVRVEQRRGKGNVVRRMFEEVDAEVFVLVDGDGTYDPRTAPVLVDLLCSRCLDMVVASRTPARGQRPFRRGHRLGNHVISGTARLLFGPGLADSLSGYRALSRAFTKAMPLVSTGFEIEAEITAFALTSGARTAEVASIYTERSPRSSSKLRPFRDGVLILLAMLRLFRDQPSRRSHDPVC